MEPRNLCITRRSFLAGSAVCAIAAGAALSGCTAATSESPDSSASQESDQAPQDSQQSESLPVEQRIIGVWNRGQQYIAFTNDTVLAINEDASSTMLNHKAAIVSPYTVEGDTISITARGISLGVQSLDETMLNLSGEVSGTYSKTADDPSTFIKDHYVVLKVGDSWENESISIKVNQFTYSDEDGFVTSEGTIISSLTDQYVVDVSVLNLTSDTVFGCGDYIINGNTIGSSSYMGTAISAKPLQEDYGLFCYEVSPQVQERVSSIELQVRYYTTGSSNKGFITPLIVIQQE